VDAVKTLIVFSFLFLSSWFTNLGWAVKPQTHPDQYDHRNRVPFKIYNGYLIVFEGRVGDFDKLKFVLDTGATQSVLDRKLAAKMGQSCHFGHVLNFDKSLNAEWVEVRDIQFGPIQASTLPMMIADLRYFQSFATQVDGVIGLDLLRRSSFSIDYDTHNIYFGALDPLSGVPMNSDAMFLTVELLLGDRPVRLVLDTGAPTLVLYEDRVLSRLPQLRIQSETLGTSMGGWVLSKRGHVPMARLGTTPWDGTVFLVKVPAHNVLSGIDGYLGMAALKAHRIDFNLETNTLSWKE